MENWLCVPCVHADILEENYLDPTFGFILEEHKIDRYEVVRLTLIKGKDVGNKENDWRIGSRFTNSHTYLAFTAEVLMHEYEGKPSYVTRVAANS